MKKILAVLLGLTAFATVTQAQDSEIRPAAIGVSLTLHDFETARLIRTTSLNRVLADKQWSKFGEQNLGFAVTYFKGLHKFVDFAGTLGGNFMKYPVPNTG